MKELRHLSVITLVLLALIAISAFYWGVVGAEGLLQRGDNPRLVEMERTIQRGKIFDRQGLLLATTTVGYDGEGLRRLYPHSEAAAVVGYYSQRYGVSGIEATYDDLLRGAIGQSVLNTTLRQTLHLPPVGGDVRLTLDLAVQKDAAAAFAGYDGAAVLITLPDGAVRAMISTPIFDPNVLDANWQHLVTAPDAPLLNRVTQGIYQPGSFMETPLLAAALTQQVPVDTVFTDGADAISLEDLTLACERQPQDADITLLQGYALACPGVFAQFTSVLTAEAIDHAFAQYGLLSTPHLAGLDTETGDSPLPLAALQSANTPSEARILATLLGQNALVISPLQALDIVAAIANNGTVPEYQLVEATRLPGQTWQAVTSTALPRAVLTRQTAEQMRTAMQSAVRDGAAAAAQAETTYPIAGHAATAYSGTEPIPLQWFVGLARFDDGSAVAVVVVLERAAGAEEAAQVGGRILNAAIRVFNTSQDTQAADTPEPSP